MIIHFAADLENASLNFWCAHRHLNSIQSCTVALWLPNIAESNHRNCVRKVADSSYHRRMGQGRGVGVFDSPVNLKNQSLFELFDGCVRRFPERVAVRFADESVSYAQLHARVESMAVRLRELGVEPGEPVALMTPRSVEMVVGIFAILRLGATYVPIDQENPPARVQSILRDSGAQVCLTMAMIRTRADVNANADTAPLPPVGPPVAPAYIMFTSGSTGVPKGIAVAHHSVTRTVVGSDYVTVGPEDNVLQLLNYAFDGSVFDIFGALLNGATLVVTEQDDITDPERLAAVIDTAGVSIALMTTALFNAYVDHDPAMFAPLRKVLFGGERASVPHVKKALAHLGPGKLVNVYGPTEATVFSCTHTVDTITEDVVPIGKPLPNTSLHVLGGDFRPVPVGVVGELYIGGNGVALGYWGKPRLTSARFVADPWLPGAVLYRSGDLVKCLDSGDLVYVGRADEQIKLRGFRIEPGEIETCLLEHPQIAQCAVVATGDRLIAYYTSAEPLEEGALKTHLRTLLPHFMVPQNFVHAEHLPLTHNGKIDRYALAARHVKPATRTLPDNRSPQTEAMHTVFAEVLGVPDVGPEDGFSDLGGNSITAMTVASRLKRAGYDVTARDILHCQTIANLLEETSLAAIDPAQTPPSDVAAPAEIHAAPADDDVARLLDDSLATNNRIVTRAKVAREYPLSAMQQLQISFVTPGSMAVDPLQRVMHLPALRRAYGKLIAQHGLLRSVPVEYGGRHVWREHDYDGEEPPMIPVIEVTGDESAVPALIDNLTTRIFKGQCVLHQLLVAVVRAGDGDRYFLIWIVSHVIFDRVSKEILSRHLIRHYDAVLNGQAAPAAARSFEDYVRQITRGPQGVEAPDIVRAFRLHAFHDAKQHTKRLVEATGSRTSTNFNIIVPLRNSWQIEHPWEAALGVHVKGLQRYLDMDELPLLFVTEGREFEDQRYYDTVGELTDMVPLFVDARLSLTEMTQSVLDRLQFVKKHNVNFLHLASAGATQSRWSEVARLMDIGDDFEHLDILMFNILGYTDNLPAESVVEARWEQPQPLRIQTLLNAITGVHSDRMVCSFRTSCTVDVDRIRMCFEHAASELT